MPMSSRIDAATLMAQAIGNFDEPQRYSQHGMAGVITGFSQATGALATDDANVIKANDGAQWIARVSPFGGGSINYSNTIFAADNTLRWLLCSSLGIGLSTGAQANNSVFTAPVTPAGYRLNRFADNNPNNQVDTATLALGYPYVICAVGDSGATGAGTGRLLRSTDRGATWTDIALPAGTFDLNGIAALQGQTWIATPSSGFGLISTDNGLTWTAYAADPAPRNALGVARVRTHFVSFSSVSAGMLQSADGITWTLSLRPTGGILGLRPIDADQVGTLSVVLVRSTQGAAFGRQVVFSVDGGARWDLADLLNTSSGPINFLEFLIARNARYGMAPTQLIALIATGKITTGAASGQILSSLRSYNPA